MRKKQTVALSDSYLQTEKLVLIELTALLASRFTL